MILFSSHQTTGMRLEELRPIHAPAASADALNAEGCDTTATGTTWTVGTVTKAEKRLGVVTLVDY